MYRITEYYHCLKYGYATGQIYTYCGQYQQCSSVNAEVCTGNVAPSGTVQTNETDLPLSRNCIR